ncbi:hypothetical protein C8Q75DRAFT_804599 [Abortiporus biennis]|nr:hypothetical protein C8Q75DRAFT_804599 [Abortiporus biennis]
MRSTIVSFLALLAATVVSAAPTSSLNPTLAKRGYSNYYNGGYFGDGDFDGDGNIDYYGPRAGPGALPNNVFVNSKRDGSGNGYTGYYSGGYFGDGDFDGDGNIDYYGPRASPGALPNNVFVNSKRGDSGNGYNGYYNGGYFGDGDFDGDGNIDYYGVRAGPGALPNNLGLASGLTEVARNVTELVEATDSIRPPKLSRQYGARVVADWLSNYQSP